ncbi:hypothetical protein HGRIS_002652 [Hohenbuehelia grisea]|uniref:Uncharacterized protein n=1 Tax=Hohenbuehelia grisea TaxID=104357 RepID=A0ABR3JLT5_9AGAR
MSVLFSLKRCRGRNGLVTVGGRRSVTSGCAPTQRYKGRPLEFTQPPSPEWKLGDGVNALKDIHAPADTFKTWSFDDPLAIRCAPRSLLVILMLKLAMNES